MKNIVTGLEAKYSESGGLSKRPFQLYDSDKQNRSTINTRKKTRPKAQQSVDSKYQSGSSIGQSSANNCRDIYISQLEDKVQELTKLLETQTVKMKAVSEERNCLRLICQKQQIKLAHTQNRDVEILKEDFKQQLEDLRLEKERIMELVSNINFDHQKEIDDLMAQLLQREESSAKIADINQSLTQGNQKLRLQTQLLTSNLMEKTNRLAQIEDQLFEKRNIERKYRMVLKQLDRREQAPSGSDL